MSSLSIWETETKELGVQCHSLLQSEFEANLSYMKHHLNTQTIKTTPDNPSKTKERNKNTIKPILKQKPDKKLPPTNHKILQAPRGIT